MWTQFITSEKYKMHFTSDTELWLMSFDEVKKYIDIHNKRPSSEDNKNKEMKVLGSWILTQQSNYKKKIKIMKEQNIYDMWTQFITSEKYKMHFISNTELWLIQFDEVKKHIDIHNKRPSQTDKNKEIKSLGSWISNQQTNYKKKIKIMKEQNIYDMWTQFITSEKYKMHFTSNTELWLMSFEEVKKYIDINNKRPSESDKNKEIKSLGKWISTQQTNYKEKTYIMKEQNLYDMWTQLITSEKYKIYFMSNTELWLVSFDEVKKHIDINNERPSETDKNKEIKSLGYWIGTQQKKYKKKTEIMKNQDIYNMWTQFITSEKYKIYFISNTELWLIQFDEVKKYIDINNKTPSTHDKNKEIKSLGYWISHQQTNYKNKRYVMKEQTIYNMWTQFITSDKYKQYFDQDIIKPDPIPIEIQNNNPLNELDIIEPVQIETKQDLKDALNNIPDITSILDKYENHLKI